MLQKIFSIIEFNKKSTNNSIKDIIDSRNLSDFVERHNELSIFYENIKLSKYDENRRFLLNISGQGGIGKSTLLRYYCRLAQQHNMIVANSDESEKTVIKVMAKLADQLNQNNIKMKNFRNRYKIYQQKNKEIMSDPEAPKGLSDLLGETVARTGIHLAQEIPVFGKSLNFLDKENVSSQFSQWSSFVIQKLSRRDDINLLLDPVKVLTKLFLLDIRKSSKNFNIILSFDAYECTKEFLDSWLKDILDGYYGDVPLNIIFIISGRQELEKSYWTKYEKLIIRIVLEPFTEEQSRQYLKHQGINDDQTVNLILKLSGGLPLLLSTLVADKSSHTNYISHPSSTALEHFLKWITDPKKQKIALDSSLPRYINLDILKILGDEDNAEELFNWLKGMPFIEERNTGWFYHDVVRTQMLRYKKLSSPQGWYIIHEKLGNYYKSLQDQLEIFEEDNYQDISWQNYEINNIYHKLCQLPTKNLPIAINECLYSLERQFTHLRTSNLSFRWSRIIIQAGNDLENEEVKEGGEILFGFLENLFIGNSNTYAIEMSKKLLSYPKIDSNIRPIIYLLRGIIYLKSGNVASFLKDCKKNDLQNINNNYIKSCIIALKSQAYYILKDYKRAIYYCDKSIAINSSISKFIIPICAASYCSLKKYDEAIANCNLAIKDNNSLDLDKLLIIRGCCYQAMGNHKKAILEFSRVLKSDENFSQNHTKKALVYRGQSYVAINQEKNASKDFRKALNFVLDSQDEMSIKLRIGLNSLLGLYNFDMFNDYETLLKINPEDYQIFHARGWTYLRQEKFIEAIYDFDEVIRIVDREHPILSRILGYRGYAFQRIGNLEKALNDYNKAIEINSEDHQILSARGELLRLSERFEDAVKDFSKALDLQPNDHWSLGKYGDCLRVVGRYSDAIEALNKAISINNKAAEHFAFRGYTHFLMGNYKDALSDFNKAIKIDPNYDWCYIRRGELYTNILSFEEALKDLEKAIKINPSALEALINYGIIYVVRSSYEISIKYFNKVIELDPNNNFALSQRGIAYVGMQYYAEAIDDFKKSIDIEPNNAFLFYLRGDSYRRIEKFSEAIRDCKKSIELDPNNNFSPLFCLGSIYISTANFDRAMTTFNKVLEIDLSNGQALFHRGRLFEIQNKYKEAIEEYERIQKSDLNYIFGIVQKGYIYRILKKYDYALEEIRKAEQIDSENIIIYPARGMTYMMMKKYRMALKDFNFCIEKNSSSDWSYFQRSIAYKKLNKLYQAEKDLEHAIQIVEQRNEQKVFNSMSIFNLGIYYFAMGDSEAAINVYNLAQDQCKSLENIRSAIMDINEYLEIFPDNYQLNKISQEMKFKLDKKNYPLFNLHLI